MLNSKNNLRHSCKHDQTRHQNLTGSETNNYGTLQLDAL